MEIEAKFTVPDRETFQHLLEAQSLGGLALGAGSVIQIQDRYLDTAEGALRAQGYACRLRRQNGSFVGGLKGLGQSVGAVHRRVEVEVELPRPLPPSEWPPGPARELALQLSESRPLHPLLAIGQTRHSRPILFDGRAIATLTLDDLHVCHDTGVLASYLEVEAELLPGQDEAELERLAGVIQADWALVPQPRSKFERAMALLQALPPAEVSAGRQLAPEERAMVDRVAQQPELMARRARVLQAWDDGLSRPEIAAHARLSPRRVRHWLSAFRRVRLGIFPSRALQSAALPPAGEAEAEGEAIAFPRKGGALPRPKQKPGLLPDDTMARAAVKILAFHNRRMLANEPGTRLGEDVEALHDMRVATRRMRAAVRIFRAAIGQEAHRLLRKGLRRTGRALGPVRDLDVFRQRTWAYRGSLAEEQRGGLDDFLEVLEVRREAAREQMIAYLDGPQYARFKGDMDWFVTGFGCQAQGAGGERVRDVVPVAVQERLAAVLAFDAEVSLPDPAPERLHALRIACKRLRYTLEFFEEVLGPGTRPLLAEIVAVQDHLGIIQDAVVAEAILRDYLATGTWGMELGLPPAAGGAPLAPGVEAYLASNVAELQRMLATFAPAWQRMAGGDFRDRIAGLVGGL